MEAKDRIPMINRCAQTLAGRGWGEIDFILGQFELPTTDQWNGPGDTEYDYVRDMLGNRYAQDENIIALHDYLHGATSHNPDEEPWADSSLRIFISHLWQHRDDAIELKEELNGWGADGFVAHRDINPGAEWVRVINAALHSCDALIALLRTGFKESDWCDQEVGVALGRQVPVVPIGIDTNPHGLLGSYQAIHWNHETMPMSALAERLFDLLLANKRTRDRSIEAMVNRVVRSRSFNEANRLSQKLRAIESEISADQIKRLSDAVEANHQVGYAWDAKDFIQRLNRASEQTPTPTEWDEAPF